MTPNKNEELYLTILKSMTGLKYVINRNYEIIFSNAENPFTLEPIKFEKVFRNGLPDFTEIQYSSGNSEQVYIFPIFDENSLVCMAGIIPRNVFTPIRQMVEESMNTKEVLLTFVEAAPFAIHAIDNEKKVILWNEKAELLFGWEKSEVIGKISPFIFMENKFNLLNDILSVRMGKYLQFFEKQRKNKFGDVIDIRLSNMPLKNSQGITVGYIEIMEDITKSKEIQLALNESYESYRTIFDSVSDALLVLDAESNAILDVNSKMIEMFGYNSRNEALRKNLEELLVADLAQIQEFFSIEKQEFVKYKTFESLAKNKAGNHFWLEVVIKGVLINGNYRTLMSARDISQRKTAEEENQKMRESLLHADKMAAIGTLASGIAHEINNPNNFILSNSQFLSEVWPDIQNVLSQYVKQNGDFFLRKMPYSVASTKIPKIIDGISEGSYRIKGIITSLRDFSKQDKTNIQQDVDVNKIIEESLIMLNNKIRNHTDFFETKITHGIPRVKGNFRQLEQVVINLVLNALESLESRDRGVTVNTSYSKKIGKVKIKISDEGIGITEEIKKHIFDPFFTTKFDTGGTGLGLFICFTIIQQHNGSLECCSEVGKGTSFTILLPIS